MPWNDMQDKLRSNKNATIRTYRQLILLPTFEERFDYLKLNGIVGNETFGFDRYLNQKFYRSNEWRRIRDEVIVRDKGCDLGLDGYEIKSKIIIHHMNPINVKDINDLSDYLLNTDYLITTSMNTHNAIHYGTRKLIENNLVTRSKNDTCPWKH